jgi:threonine/homoserine/homoserine lactone efflux protein
MHPVEAAALLLYFIPALIAFLRGHQSWPAIAILDLLLGWSVIGWIIALIWSLTAVRRETVIVLRERW